MQGPHWRNSSLCGHGRPIRAATPFPAEGWQPRPFQAPTVADAGGDAPRCVRRTGIYTHRPPSARVRGVRSFFKRDGPEVWLSPLDTPTRHSRVYASRRAPALSPLRSRASRVARAAAGGARAAGAGGSPPSRHSSGRGAEVDPGPRSLLSHSVLYLSPKNFRTHATQGGATNYNTHTRTTLLYGTVTIHS